ncbi:MAG: winged helix-turn-helix transcriptional regulator [Chloroflexi bacterium]|nr:winged helix-turn-helix transcriptional regulator [Chloroflexota bacterium]
MVAVKTFVGATPGARQELTTRFFRALGDPTRLKLLDLLMDGERSVGELVARVGSPQGRISAHLACLKQCGLVATRREGKFVYYRIADAQVRRLLETAQGMIARNAAAIWACTQVAPGEVSPEQVALCPGLADVSLTQADH